MLLAPGGGGELASSGGASGASRLHLELPTRDYRWRDGAGSPKPKTFLDLALLLPGSRLICFFTCIPICQCLDSLGLQADIFQEHRPCGLFVVLAQGKRVCSVEQGC